MNYQPLNQTERTCPNMNLAAMVFGIIGLLLCFIPVFGLGAPSTAIILALLGRGNTMEMKGQGLGGFVMGILGIIGNLVFTVVIMVAVVAALLSAEGMF